LKDESQDTGYLILSLTETMEESRRLRQELKSGIKVEQPAEASSEEAMKAAPPERVSLP
jgi:hypothetical protein